MTKAATSSVEIDAPVEVVFDYVADPVQSTQAMARAFQRRVRVTDVQTTPEGVVTSWTWGIRVVPPLFSSAKATRVEHIPNRRIVNRHNTATHDIDTISLEPTAAGGTRLTWHSELSSSIPLVESLAILMTARGRGYERQIADLLAIIKQDIESSRSVHAA